MADTLDVREVIVPIHQGVFSAFGLISADMRVDVSQTTNMRSDLIDLDDTNAVLARLVARALRDLKNDGYRSSPVCVVTFEMRYSGQNYGVEIPVPLSDEGLSPNDLEAIFRRFHDRHKALYGYDIAEEIVEIIDFNVTAIGEIPKLALPKIAVTGRVQPTARRAVFFADVGSFVDCPVYERADICADTIIDGPAVIEEDYSVTLALPGHQVSADAWGNLYIRRL